MGTLGSARTARRLALAAALLAALLVGAELALRALKLGAPIWHRPDASLGWSLRPYAGGHDGGEHAHVNGQGRRDGGHTVDKRDGVYRIIVLGDERSEAIGLALRATWWWQLPANLGACGFAGGRKIEVLNFGVAGYSTAQESIVLESSVLRYRPDLVLLQFSSGKDVRENSRSLASRRDRPFYRLDERGRLRLDESFVDRSDFERRSQFRYDVARELSDRSRLLQLLGKADFLDATHAGAAAPASPLAALEPPHDARWEDAWRVTEALLQRMQEYAERNGARFGVVAVPHPVELQRGASYSDVRLSAFGERQGIPMIVLAPRIRPTMREFYSTDGQWTLVGHRAAAQGIAAGLCAALLQPARRRG